MIHAGGTPVMLDTRLGQEGSIILATAPIEDDGATATLQLNDGANPYVIVVLHRPDRVNVRWPNQKAPLKFWTLISPEKREEVLVWNHAAELRVTKGSLKGINSRGFSPAHAVGNGKLNLIDPAARDYPTMEVAPTADGVELEVRLSQKQG